MTTDPNEARQDKSFAERLAYETFTEAQLSRWYECSSQHNFAGHQEKKLVIHSLFCGYPSVQDTLTCKSIDLSMRDGITTTWERGDGEVFTLSYAPIEVGVGCFIYHPAHSQVVFSEYRNRYNAKFSLAARTTLKPSVKKDGCVYLMEKFSFDNLYPGVLSNG